MPCRLALVLTTRRRTVTDVFSAFCHYFTFVIMIFCGWQSFHAKELEINTRWVLFLYCTSSFFVGIVECTFVVAFPKNFWALDRGTREYLRFMPRIRCWRMRVTKALDASLKPYYSHSTEFPKVRAKWGGDGVCSVVERIMQLRRLSEVFNELGRKKCASKLGKY